jgi:predicted glycoside hydrolase/deacetylase ChbG (UPF0249 family)
MDGPVSRFLIVNADDFGRSVGINNGVIAAYENGIVTSASLMVRWPAAVAAASFARTHPLLGVGLHLDLGEWVRRDGSWDVGYTVVPTDDAVAVTAEAEKQLSDFRDIMGHDPTHLDSHQHAHRDEPVRSILSEMAERLNVPLRHVTPGITYCGRFYGQDRDGTTIQSGLSANTLASIILSLPDGVTELACHPAADVDWESDYATERLEELKSLCSREAREAVVRTGITLGSFRTFPR